LNKGTKRCEIYTSARKAKNAKADQSCKIAKQKTGKIFTTLETNIKKKYVKKQERRRKEEGE